MTNFTYITFWKVPICKICGETATGLFSGRSSRLPTCEQAAPSPFCDWHCQKAFSVRPQWQINTYLLETGKTVTNNSPPPRLICFLGELCEHPSEHETRCYKAPPDLPQNVLTFKFNRFIVSQIRYVRGFRVRNSTFINLLCHPSVIKQSYGATRRYIYLSVGFGSRSISGSSVCLRGHLSLGCLGSHCLRWVAVF